MTTKATPKKHGRTVVVSGPSPMAGASFDFESTHAEWIDYAERAVNAHADLVAALRSIVDSVGCIHVQSDGPGRTFEFFSADGLAAARAALALVEGGTK